MTILAGRPKPFVVPAYCKGCGRCIGACAKHCLAMGTEINPETGLVPVVMDLDDCNGCALCAEACPEPHGLHLLDETFDILGRRCAPGRPPFGGPPPRALA